MYDFRIYNRVLTSQEVNDIHGCTYYQIDATVTMHLHQLSHQVNI